MSDEGLDATRNRRNPHVRWHAGRCRRTVAKEVLRGGAGRDTRDMSITGMEAHTTERHTLSADDAITVRITMR